MHACFMRASSLMPSYSDANYRVASALPEAQVTDYPSHKMRADAEFAWRADFRGGAVGTQAAFADLSMRRTSVHAGTT